MRKIVITALEIKDVILTWQSTAAQTSEGLTADKLQQVLVNVLIRSIFERYCFTSLCNDVLLGSVQWDIVTQSLLSLLVTKI